MIDNELEPCNIQLTTCYQSPLFGAAAACNRARLCSSGCEANKVVNEDSTNSASQERCLQVAVPAGGGSGWNDVAQRNK